VYKHHRGGLACREGCGSGKLDPKGCGSRGGSPTQLPHIIEDGTRAKTSGHDEDQVLGVHRGGVLETRSPRGEVGRAVVLVLMPQARRSPGGECIGTGSGAKRPNVVDIGAVAHPTQLDEGANAVEWDRHFDEGANAVEWDRHFSTETGVLS
jgi:hypothetical protein